MTQLQPEFCRVCRDEDLSERADFIVWGKLFPSEELGPRCIDHLPDQVYLSQIDQHAVYDLRPVNRLLDQRPHPRMEDKNGHLIDKDGTLVSDPFCRECNP